jgi:hypothetical protein
MAQLNEALLQEMTRRLVLTFQPEQLGQSVLKSVQQYLAAVAANGITVERGVVFGSQASGIISKNACYDGDNQ